MSLSVESPAVSVVVPVFNTVDYLRQCLDSLVNQSLSSIEIICVDNGSTDGSLDVLREYERQYPKIVVLQHLGGKQSGARNAGIDVARGDYIGFVDSDDYVDPDMFEYLYRAADDNKACISVCNGIAFREEDSCTSLILSDKYLSAKRIFDIKENSGLLRNTTVCNKLYSSDFLRSHSLRFPEGLVYEDLFFVIVAYLYADSITAVPEHLYYYRKNRAGSTTTNRGNNVFDIFAVMKKIKAVIEQRSNLVEYRPILYETMALKYMNLMHKTRAPYRRRYYKEMRSEITRFQLRERRIVLNLREYREFRVIRKCDFSMYSLFLLIRLLYGKLRMMRVAT